MLFRSGSITDIENRAFASSLVLETLKIPEGVKVLDGNIFEDCTALKTIYLPSTLEKMDSQCFKNLKSLSEIYLNKSGDMEVKEDILLSTPISNATLYVPQGTKTKYESLAPWSGFGNIVEHESLINTVKSVADNGKMSVVMNCGKMSINDYQAGETILVISSNGTIINSLKGNGETLEIDITEKGLIIVKAGNEVIKVIN